MTKDVGKKVGMTQIFTLKPSDPVAVIEATPNVVLQEVKELLKQTDITYQVEFR